MSVLLACLLAVGTALPAGARASRQGAARPPTGATESGCLDIVGGSGLFVVDEDRAPDGTNVSTAGTLFFRVLLAAGSCPQARYELVVLSQPVGLAYPAVSLGGGDVLADETRRGDGRPYVDFELPVRSPSVLLARLTTGADCVRVQGRTSLHGEVADEAPGGGGDVQVCSSPGHVVFE